MTDHRIYNLADPTDFAAYADKYGYENAKGARFGLAYAGGSFGRWSSNDPRMKDLQKLPKMRKLVDCDYAAIEARTVAWDDVNPKPYYSYLCSAITLTAVYKAHVATDTSYPSWGGLDLHDWRNLSYATERGIVFG